MLDDKACSKIIKGHKIFKYVGKIQQKFNFDDLDKNLCPSLFY